MNPHRKILAALVLPAVLLLAGCSGGTSTPDTPPDTAAPPAIDNAVPPAGDVPTLDQTEWEAININDEPIASDQPVEVSFDNGNMSGNDGCNSFNGGYEQTGDELKATAGLMQTLIGCEEAVSEQAATFTALMTGPTTMSMDGEDLILTGPAGTAKMQLLENG